MFLWYSEAVFQIGREKSVSPVAGELYHVAERANPESLLFF